MYILHEIELNYSNRKRELNLSFKEDQKLYMEPLQLYLLTILEAWQLVALKKVVAH